MIAIILSLPYSTKNFNINATRRQLTHGQTRISKNTQHRVGYSCKKNERVNNNSVNKRLLQRIALSRRGETSGRRPASRAQRVQYFSNRSFLQSSYWRVFFLRQEPTLCCVFFEFRTWPCVNWRRVTFQARSSSGYGRECIYIYIYISAHFTATSLDVTANYDVALELSRSNYDLNV